MLVKLSTYSWQIPIQVTFEDCVIEKLSLSKRKETLTYIIGSEKLSWPMPQVK